MAILSDSTAKSLARLLNLNATDSDAYQQAFDDYFSEINKSDDDSSSDKEESSDD